VLDFFLEEFVIHGHFSQLLLQPDDLQVSGVLGALLQYRAAGAQELFPPLREPGGSHAQFPGEQLQVFTSQQTQDDLDFPPGGKSAWALGPSGQGHLRSPCGLPPMALAANHYLAPWGHLLGIFYFTQISVQKNRRPGQWKQNLATVPIYRF